MRHRRLCKEDRYNQILEEGIKLSCEIGFQVITREKLATELRIAESLINAYFGTMEALKIAVLESAIKTKNPVILMQMQACNHPLFRKV